MLYKAKVAVCSDIRTRHSTQSERHVEFLNVKPCWYGKKPLGFKRLNSVFLLIVATVFVSYIPSNLNRALVFVRFCCRFL